MVEPTSLETKFIEANGIRFACLEQGEGPLVLLIHGFPDTPHTWGDVLPLIAEKGYRAVAPWTRGYHPSGIPTRDADADDLADDVIALIEALGEESAVLVGHDWGASAVYGAAAKAPHRVKKLITLAIPHPLAVKPSLKLLWGVRHFVAYKLPGAPARFAADDFAALRAIYKRWAPLWDPPAAEFEPVLESFAVEESLNAAFGYYRTLSPVLPSYLKKPYDMPGVAFAGLDDPIITPAPYHKAKRFYANGYEVEEMRGGHFLHREHPQVFAERLLSHL